MHRKTLLGATGFVFVAFFAAGAHALVDGEKLLTAGPLEGDRNESHVCTIVNKGTAEIRPAITLKDADGNVLVGPLYHTVPPNSTDSVSRVVPFPGPESVYCHVQVETEDVVVGNLRVNEAGGRTRVESPLEANLHGKLNEIKELVENLGGGGLLCRVVRSGNIVGSWNGVNQSPTLSCGMDELAMAPGWKFDDPDVTVRMSRQTPGNPSRWEWQLRRVDNRDTSFAEVRMLCCLGSILEP